MNYRLLGRRIQERRAYQRISQEKLAEMIDVSVTYVCAVENARKHPSLKTLVNIANALETTPDFLLYGNLQHDASQSKNEFGELLQDCNLYERYVIIALAKCLKATLREIASVAEQSCTVI